VRGAREHNLKNVDLDIPRDALVVFIESPARANPRSRSARSLPRRSGDISNLSPHMPKGRCETCEGEGFVFVELLFLPSVYAPCPTCHGAR
jgi:excinuclease ABC subunit A